MQFREAKRQKKREARVMEDRVKISEGEKRILGKSHHKKVSLRRLPKLMKVSRFRKPTKSKQGHI